jgi:hypothetical protein
VAAASLPAVEVPLSPIFGADDDYLNPGLARHLGGCFKTPGCT